MSIKTEIDRIKQSKADIISALKSKGVTVPSDASIDDLSALVEAIEINTSEDLSSELTTQNTLITTQETTIDNIISALEGKASGGSGGNIETCRVEFFDSKMSGRNVYVWATTYTNGEIIGVDPTAEGVLNLTLEDVIVGSDIIVFDTSLPASFTLESCNSNSIITSYGQKPYLKKITVRGDDEIDAL